MVKNTDFLASETKIPYIYCHYNLSSFALNKNGKQIPTEGLSLGIDHKKTSVMGYSTLFEGSGIHHSNSGHQITHDMCANVHFMLLFYLTPDRGASEGHMSNPGNGNIRVELKFSKPLTEPITCVLYLEYDNSIHVDTSRTISDRFLKNEHDADIVYAQRREIVLGSLLPDMLPRSVTQSGTFIINAVHHTENLSHLLAVQFLPKSSRAYFFDSYGIAPLVHDIAAFI